MASRKSVNRGEISNDRAIGVEAALESLQSNGGLIFPVELNVDVADHVIGEVVADVKGLDVAVVVEFLENVLVEVLEVVLNVAGVDGHRRLG